MLVLLSCCRLGCRKEIARDHFWALLGWWSERPRGAGERSAPLGPCSAMPRATRQCTWPGTLRWPSGAEDGGGADAGSKKAKKATAEGAAAEAVVASAAATGRCTVPCEIAPVWEPLTANDGRDADADADADGDGGGAGGGDDGAAAAPPLLEVPSHMDLHFSVRSMQEVLPACAQQQLAHDGV